MTILMRGTLFSLRHHIVNLFCRLTNSLECSLGPPNHWFGQSRDARKCKRNHLQSCSHNRDRKVESLRVATVSEGKPNNEITTDCLKCLELLSQFWYYWFKFKNHCFKWVNQNTFQFYYHRNYTVWKLEEITSLLDGKYQIFCMHIFFVGKNWSEGSSVAIRASQCTFSLLT